MKPNYERIIYNLAKQHKITIKKWRSTDTGEAYIRLRSIEIPDPKSINRFLTGLHEVGHVVKDKDHNPLWKSEHIAYKYAFDYCDEHDIKYTELNVKRASNYVKMCVGKGIRARLNLNKVTDEVLEFAEIDREEWRDYLNKGFKPFVKCQKGNWTDVVVIWTKQ